jgi:hypothetical protein
MGTLVNGINGPIKGKVGSVHGSSRHGKYYIKGPHKERTKKVSVPEKQNRSKFTDAQVWLQPITDYVRQGFNGFTYKDSSQGFLAAKSHLLLNAFEGKAPDLVINPALAKVSYGSLGLANHIKVEVLDEHQLKFTWENTWEEGMGYYDQTMLLAYDIENHRPFMKITGQFRYLGEDVLQVSYPEGLNSDQKKGATFHCYFAFVAADRSRQSDSIYLGEVTF